MATLLGYMFGGSHDNAPLEIDADNHAGKPYRDPYSGGAWPVIKDAQDTVESGLSGVGQWIGGQVDAIGGWLKGLV
jgi:hypothetical protein